MPSTARLRRRLCCGLALAVAAGVGWAQPQPQPQSQPPREAAVKAAYLFKFASFVEWPAGTFQRVDDPLVIGVLGDDEVAAELGPMVAGRAVDGRPIVARRLAEGAATAGVHVLYVANHREQRTRDIIASAAGPVLVVCDQPSGLRAGAVLAFVPDGGRIRFAASLPSAEARNLRLSARLLAVAASVEGRPR